VLLMPYPHALSVVGDPTLERLVAGLVALGRRVVTFDPPVVAASRGRLGYVSLKWSSVPKKSWPRSA
jgi:hypothetical protein